MFEATVVPVSDYASGVWGYRDFSSVNNVHNHAIRFWESIDLHQFLGSEVSEDLKICVYFGID